MKKKKQQLSPLRFLAYSLPVLIAAFAFLQAGMPPIDTTVLTSSKTLFPCHRLCGLALHRPGISYADFIVETLQDAVLPARASAAQIFYRRVFTSPAEMEDKVKLQDGVLLLADGYKGGIFSELYTFPGGTPFTLTLLHDNTAAAAGQLLIDGKIIPPNIIDKEKIIWRGQFPPPIRGQNDFLLRFDNEGRGEFRLKEISIEKK